MKQQARKGYQRYLKYVGEASADGERLSAIEKGGNPIRDIAVREAYETDGADPIGRAAPPKFDVEGYIEIDVQNNKLDPFAGVTMRATRAEIDYYYTPSQAIDIPGAKSLYKHNLYRRKCRCRQYRKTIIN
jgi:hypothetical protein